MPKTVQMYEIGEEVLIKAKITDIVVENGELKYKIKAEHSNNDLDHNFTEHQLISPDDKDDEYCINDIIDAAMGIHDDDCK